MRETRECYFVWERKALHEIVKGCTFSGILARVVSRPRNPRGFFIWSEAMWTIIGVDKVTGKLVEVTTADNPAEKEIILRQEARNYDDVRAVPLRTPMTGPQTRTRMGYASA